MKSVLRSILEIAAFCYLAMVVFSIFIMAYMRWGNVGDLSTRWELLADCLLHALIWPVYLPMYLFGSHSFLSAL